MSQLTHFPLYRHLPEPGHAGVFEWGVRVQPARDCLRDHRAPLLLQQIQQTVLALNQSVKVRCLMIKEGNDSPLLSKWRNWQFQDCL